MMWPFRKCPEPELQPTLENPPEFFFAGEDGSKYRIVKITFGGGSEIFEVQSFHGGEWKKMFADDFDDLGRAKAAIARMIMTNLLYRRVGAEVAWPSEADLSLGEDHTRRTSEVTTPPRPESEPEAEGG